jgi:chaperone modulatory protein CbpM
MSSQALIPRLPGLIVEEQAELTLQEVCRVCAAQAGLILELIEEGVIDPLGPAPERWRFTGVQVQRARVALRLQQDLGINPAGSALVLQLLEEVHTLRAQLTPAAEPEQAPPGNAR